MPFKLSSKEKKSTRIIQKKTPRYSDAKARTFPYKNNLKLKTGGDFYRQSNCYSALFSFSDLILLYFSFLNQSGALPSIESVDIFISSKGSESIHSTLQW